MQCDECGQQRKTLGQSIEEALKIMKKGEPTDRLDLVRLIRRHTTLFRFVLDTLNNALSYDVLVRLDQHDLSKVYEDLEESFNTLTAPAVYLDKIIIEIEEERASTQRENTEDNSTMVAVA